MSAGKAAQTLWSRLNGVVTGLQQGYKAVAVGVPIAYKNTESVVSKHFNAALKNNAQYVVKDQEAADKLLKQWFWTRVNRIPGALEEAKAEAKALPANLQWSRLRAGEVSVGEAGIALGFAAELYAWWCVGEIVGRGGTLTGYSLK